MELYINKKPYQVDAQPDDSLLSVLREDLDLTGSKYGCGEGACGACKVLINDVATPSCITKVGSVVGKQITTIEGIGMNELSPVQRACLSVDVFQCGYCASGMIVAATSLLKKHPQPTEDEIRVGMQGNICRCGTHPRIMRAIKEASTNQR
ncbi:(2Fe-2S)-binding protein [Chryseolinea sp. T2]|uniref:(2Fe-2S)-binding protein n=1 Tax=Chryseolinea sp. T2 TaxID=3129255 RepID=UPI0030776421